MGKQPEADEIRTHWWSPFLNALVFVIAFMSLLVASSYIGRYFGASKTPSGTIVLFLVFGTLSFTVWFISLQMKTSRRLNVAASRITDLLYLQRALLMTHREYLMTIAYAMFDLDPKSPNANAELRDLRFEAVRMALYMWLDGSIELGDLLYQPGDGQESIRRRQVIMSDVIRFMMKKNIIDITKSTEHAQLVKWLFGNELEVPIASGAEKKAPGGDPRKWTGQDTAKEKPAVSPKTTVETIISEELRSFTVLDPDDPKNT